MTNIIAAISLKGGSGKTSLVQNVGYELALLGQRVLLIDLDQQANLTMGCGLDPGQGKPPIYQAMENPSQAHQQIQPVGDRLDLLAANLDLAEAEIRYASAVDRNTKIQAVVQALQHQYDAIWLDCPPGLDFASVNALIASTQAIIPLQCHFYAYRMLDPVLAIIEKAQTMNPDLRLSHIVPTMYDSRNSLSTGVVDAARERFGPLVTTTMIPINVRIADAPMHGLSVAQHAPRSKGALAYHELAKEIQNHGH